MKTTSLSNEVAEPLPVSELTRPSGNGGASNGDHDHMQQILHAMLAFRNGDFGQRLPAEWSGVHGKISDAFNDILTISERRATETARICRQVGKEGKLKQRMIVPGAPSQIDLPP
jgi:hypothetical protein